MSAQTAAGAPPAAPAPPRRRHPSAGFVAVCATYAAAVAFLLWGLSTPALDRVWTLHHELKIGTRGAPGKADQALLRRALARYPALAGSLLSEGSIGLLSAHRDGWLETTDATVLRTGEARERLLRIDVGTPLDLLPYAIDVEGEGFAERLTAREHRVLEVKLPPSDGAAGLFVIKLRGKKLRADPSVLNVRVTFAEGAS